MSFTMHRRLTAGLAAAALLGTSTLLITPATAQDVDAPVDCEVTSTARVFAFNDFHGRILDAPAFFTPMVEERKQYPDDVLIISSGDAFGASIFESMINNDNPVGEILNAAGVDAFTVGNHEFDQGGSDLSGRIADATDGSDLGANVYKKGTEEVAAPLKAYEIYEVAGRKIAVIGAVTADVPALVSPAGVADLTIGDPVEAINREAAALRDEVDLVIASVHEGAANGDASGDDNAANSEAFASIYNDVSTDVDLILNGHTHQVYSYTANGGQQILQAGQYGENYGYIDVNFGADGEFCNAHFNIEERPEQPNLDLPEIAEIQRIVDEAVKTADEKGAEQIGTATEAVSTPDGSAGVRDVESPLNNAVAQMFYDVLGNGDEEFIGVQNPGGTRASIDKGEITYKEAALVLPFANSLMTTELTGAQVKEMLEQQWQRNEEGNVPSRPFLRLGLSKNVSYTYDESRDEGDRITGVFINGKPIDPEKKYTVGSGSFLISGGDNFRAVGEGTNTLDAGRADLEAWVQWLGDQDGEFAPDYSKRGTSVQTKVDGDKLTIDLGKAPEGGLARESLSMALKDEGNVSPAQPETDYTVLLGDIELDSGAVVEDSATAELQVPLEESADADFLTVQFAPSGTEVYVPVQEEWKGEPSPEPSPTTVSPEPSGSDEPTDPESPEPSDSGSPAPAPTVTASQSPSAKPSPGKPGLPKTGV